MPYQLEDSTDFASESSLEFSASSETETTPLAAPVQGRGRYAFFYNGSIHGYSYRRLNISPSNGSSSSSEVTDEGLMMSSNTQLQRRNETPPSQSEIFTDESRSAQDAEASNTTTLPVTSATTLNPDVTSYNYEDENYQAIEANGAINNTMEDLQNSSRPAEAWGTVDAANPLTHRISQASLRATSGRTLYNSGAGENELQENLPSLSFLRQSSMTMSNGHLTALAGPSQHSLRTQGATNAISDVSAAEDHIQGLGSHVDIDSDSVLGSHSLFARRTQTGGEREILPVVESASHAQDGVSLTAMLMHQIDLSMPRSVSMPFTEADRPYITDIVLEYGEDYAQGTIASAGLTIPVSCLQHFLVPGFFQLGRDAHESILTASLIRSRGVRVPYLRPPLLLDVLETLDLQGHIQEIHAFRQAAIETWYKNNTFHAETPWEALNFLDLIGSDHYQFVRRLHIHRYGEMPELSTRYLEAVRSLVAAQCEVRFLERPSNH